MKLRSTRPSSPFQCGFGCGVLIYRDVMGVLLARMLWHMEYSGCMYLGASGNVRRQPGDYSLQRLHSEDCV
jgi:hypothetical protein